MASIDEIANELRRVLAILDIAIQHVQRAGQPLGEASEVWQQATYGSTSSEVEEVGKLWQHAADRIIAAFQDLMSARERLQCYLDNLEGTSQPAAPSVSAAAPKPVARDGRSVHERYPDKVREIQRRIGTTPDGAETIGVWIKPDGTTEDLHSGKNTEWYAETRQTLLRLGSPKGRELARLSTHVEPQFVRRMQDKKMTEATLVLSRRPCGSPPDPSCALHL